MRKFVKNEIQIMVNVDIFSEGFDCPDVEFIQLARPTWSLAKYLQQVGRGLRPCIGKQKTVILDNSRMFVKYGLPSEKRFWSWHFNGAPASKNLYKQENSYNEAILMYMSKNSKEIMVKIDQESIESAEKKKNDEDRRTEEKVKATIKEERRLRIKKWHKKGKRITLINMIIRIAIIAAFIGLLIWQPGLIMIVGIIGLLMSLLK